MIPGKPPLKGDNLWLGIGIGLVFPAICFFIYRMLMYPSLGFPRNLIRYLMVMESLSDILILCTIGNLLVFYISLKRTKLAKGIIYSTVAYVLLIFFLKFFVETTA